MNFPLANLLFPAIWILASAVYRKVTGKPIFHTVPSNSDYRVYWIRGGSQRGIWRGINVSLTPTQVVVCPMFPFNLFFFPEAFQLEHRINYSDIINISLLNGLPWGQSVEIVWKPYLMTTKSVKLTALNLEELSKKLEAKLPKTEQGAAANP